MATVKLPNTTTDRSPARKQTSVARLPAPEIDHEQTCCTDDPFHPGRYRPCRIACLVSADRSLRGCAEEPACRGRCCQADRRRFGEGEGTGEQGHRALQCR